MKAVRTNRFRQQLLRRLEALCRERGYALCPRPEPILNDLVQMHRLTGDFYCPCQVERVAETVCPCSAVRHGLVELEGACLCGLVVLPGEGNSPSL